MDLKKMNDIKKACLILANGEVFEGKSFGKEGAVIGEVVFTTAMTGYQETLTDPGFCGQLVTQTFPLIGNYGVNGEDSESQASAGGYIVREYCETPSNFRAKGDIDGFLTERGIIGLYDIDTRQLTRTLRENGTMNGMITTGEFTVEEALGKINAHAPGRLVPEISVKAPEEHACENARFRVALVDFGHKQSLVRELGACGATVTVFPWNTGAGELTGFAPHGVLLSDGPGDPAELLEAVETIKKLTECGIPLFGIGLGHQLLALARGGRTVKLKYGHRGGNQPVIDLRLDRTFITAQNHGYAVVPDSIPAQIGEISHINANDKTCEGVRYLDAPAFSVQFQPQSHGGPNDTAYLFDTFTKMMEKNLPTKG